MKKTKYLCVALLLVGLSAFAARQPNVLFFSLDDMNDWVGAMGYEQAITPNMDRLAKGGVNFLNAHTAGVFCAPSRSAIFTGRHASTTGCYTTQVYFQNNPDIVPLQKLFHDAGYATYGAGKLFHHPKGYIDQRGWTEYFFRTEKQRKEGWEIKTWPLDDPILPKPFPYSPFAQGRKIDGGLFLEWGPILNENEEKMADTMRTEWACDLLSKKHDKPLFVGVGLYATHFPNYAPEKYFDLYDVNDIELPPYKADDLDDLPPAVKRAKTARSAHHKKLESLDAVEDAIHGYLACISYQDAMLGRLLKAIESGPNADNTIVVLWSDQGYHHGEKMDWGKHTLWERTSNVPFIWAGPGIFKGANVDATVSLMDMFPTLTELCGLADSQKRDGESLVPVLKKPSSAKERDVLLPGMEPEEYAVINSQWRYIRYADGTEELYNVKQDPNEWDNRANNPEFEGVKQELRASAPQTFADPGPNHGELKLQIKGDSYEWKSKHKAPVKVVPGQGVPMAVRYGWCNFPVCNLYGGNGMPASPFRTDDFSMPNLTGERLGQPFTGIPAEWGRPMEVLSAGDGKCLPLDVAGMKAWKAEGSYLYLRAPDLNEPASVKIHVLYYDEGFATIQLRYDSTSEEIFAGKVAGRFKPAGEVTCKNSRQWKVASFELPDAKFAKGCNGGDIRLQSNGALLIGGIYVQLEAK